MEQFTFGGPLPAVLDPRTRQRVVVRCTGVGALEIHDAAAFETMSASAGGADAVIAWVKRALLQQLGAALEQRIAAGEQAPGVLMSCAMPDTLDPICAAIAAQLAGARIRIGDLQLGLAG